MIEWSLEALRACERVQRIVVAAPPGHEHELGGGAPAGDGGESGPASDAAEPELKVVDGGHTRARSVANALAVVETELVAIHDAARPLLTRELLEALVSALEESPEAAGVIAATPVTDTVKRVAGAEPSSSSFRGSLRTNDVRNEPRNVVETLERSGLWAAQTPQLFRTEALRAALAASPGAEEATDEAMLVERAGGTVLIHPCGPENMKVTTPLDLRLAELLLAERSLAEEQPDQRRREGQLADPERDA
jgi:2-C-methyl-D-erythritol 4-phosphate cytidylyltransferase